MSNYKIGEEILFKHYGVTKSGIIVEIKENEILVMIPSSQIISIVESEVIQNVRQ